MMVASRRMPERPFTVPALHDPSRMVTYKAHDPGRVICPATRANCHTLAGCRFTSCMYGHGGLCKPAVQVELALPAVTNRRVLRRTLHA